MDRERLNHLMQDPSSVQRSDIADLKAMTERYPWFSGAHLLLAVGDHASGDVLFDEQLRTTAAHLPSRAVLFDLVQTEVEEAAPPRLTVVPPTPVPPAPPVTVPPSVVEAPLAVVLPEPIEVPAPDPSPEPEVIAPAVIAAPIITEATPGVVETLEELRPTETVELSPPSLAETEPGTNEVPFVPEDVEPPVDAAREERDPLDKQIRDAALASSYALVLEHSPAPAPPPVAEVPEVLIAPASAPAEAPATLLKPRRDRMRFTDWLQVPEEGAVENAPPPPPVAPVLPTVTAPIAPEPAPLPRAQGALASAPAPAAPPSDTRSLIERFIQQSVQAAPAKKAEFYTPQLAAKRSLEDHSDLVSETLAKVYEAQGNYTKALAAYQRLALKHPDKSTYFAALSKAVEAKMSK